MFYGIDYFLKIKILLFLILNWINIPAQNNTYADSKIILAKVAGREITLDDFYSRAEYTVRPSYCKGNNNIDKKIVLNSLIAEKMLALRSEAQFNLINDERIYNMIAGLKEQKMRALLSYYEGDSKVKRDTNELKKIYSVAGRTYRIEYFNIPNEKSAKSLYKKFSGSDSSFNKIYKTSAVTDSIYTREVSWSDPEAKEIHKTLFSEKLKKNQLIGPININDSTHLFINIKGWNDRVVITNKEITERWTDVVEKVTREKADSIYDKFVLGVMGDKTLTFNADVFAKVAKLLAPFYLNQKKRAEDEFLNFELNKSLWEPFFGEVADFNKIGGNYNEIKNLAFFSIDGKNWTVSDFKKEFDKHPMIFRKDDSKKGFNHGLKNAIVDLVRDKYLNDIAYKRGYDKNKIVEHYEQSWLDASKAFFQRDEYLKNFDVKGKKEIEIIEKYLNPYIEKLLKDYSPQIEINVEEFNKIILTRIDMFAVQSQVPYPVYVPAFPQLTNYNRLDYGRKMDAEN
jgi:hypothetical protein